MMGARWIVSQATSMPQVCMCVHVCIKPSNPCVQPDYGCCLASCCLQHHPTAPPRGTWVASVYGVPGLLQKKCHTWMHHTDVTWTDHVGCCLWGPGLLQKKVCMTAPPSLTGVPYNTNHYSSISRRLSWVRHGNICRCNRLMVLTLATWALYEQRWQISIVHHHRHPHPMAGYPSALSRLLQGTGSRHPLCWHIRLPLRILCPLPLAPAQRAGWLLANLGAM